MLKGCVHPGPSCIAVYVVVYIVVFYRCPRQTKLSIFVSLSWDIFEFAERMNGNDGHCDIGDDDDNDDHHHNVLVAMMIQTKTEMVMVAMKTKKTTTD